MSGQHLEVYNSLGIETVNDLDPTFVVIYKGTQADFSAQKAWRAWPEAPTVFVRPTAGSWIGGFTIFRRRNDNIEMYMKGQFEYVVCCSTKGWQQGSQTNFGLETFDANGALLFSTGQRFARVTQIVSIPGPTITSGGVIVQGTAPLAGWSSMPWINPAMATLTGATVAGGGDLSYQESYLIQINAALTQMRMTLGDTISAGNYLAGKLAYFPMGYIDGN